MQQPFLMHLLNVVALAAEGKNRQICSDISILKYVSKKYDFIERENFRL
jgi:hypothetical protein